MSKVTISLSINYICSALMAQAAIRHHLCPDRPALLTPDHTDALSQLMRHSWAEVCWSLPVEVDVDADHTSDLLSVTLQSPASISASSLRLMLSNALTSRVAAIVWASSDRQLSAQNTQHYRQAISSLAQNLNIYTPATILTT